MKHLNLLFSSVLLMLLLSITLCACSNEKESTTGNNDKTITLNVYNWGEYISDGKQGSVDTNKEFEKYCLEKLGIKVTVNYTTYATNEDMYSKLKSGAGAYDIVIPSDYMIQKMINDEDGCMLLPFDASTIENYKYIANDFKNAYYDEANMYSVPYTYGMMGVIYNTAFVDPEDYESKSWSLLWNEKYKGKILQFNNPRDAFGSAMYLQQLDINSEDPEVWNRALEKLSAQKPLLQGYVNDEIFNKMTTASAAIAPYFAGDFISMASQNDDLAFYYPTEGVNYFVDAMCIMKDSKQPELAKEYINFMLSERIAVANAVYIGYASPNKLVYDKESGYINPEYLKKMGDDAIEILYYASPLEINASYNALHGTTCYKSFSPEIQAHVNTLWETLKTENSTEPWIHIATGIIVGAVVILTAYTTYIKKKRSHDYRLRDKVAKAKRI